LRESPLRLHPEHAAAQASRGDAVHRGRRAGEQLALERGAVSKAARSVYFGGGSRSRAACPPLSARKIVSTIVLVDRPAFKLTTRTSPPFLSTASPPAMPSGR